MHLQFCNFHTSLKNVQSMQLRINSNPMRILIIRFRTFSSSIHPEPRMRMQWRAISTCTNKCKQFERAANSRKQNVRHSNVQVDSWKPDAQARSTKYFAQHQEVCTCNAIISFCKLAPFASRCRSALIF